jgi:hypothetical protein
MTLIDEVVQGVPVYKTLKLSEVKDVSTDSAMRLAFTVSNEEVDRDGDSLDAKGWTLGNYTKNPVVMWAHDYTKLPVGRAIKTWVVGTALNSIVEFTPDELYDADYHGLRGSTVFRFYKNGFLNAVSAGFYPIDWEAMKKQNGDANYLGGTHFMKQDLIEYSCVPVPSNPGALQIGASAKDVTNNELKSMRVELKKWAEDALKNCSCPNEKALGISDEAAGGALVPEGGDTNNKGDVKMRKGAISYKDAHPNGTPLSAKDATWNANSERSKATKAEHFRAMHAGFTGDDESTKDGYQYAHHTGDAPHEVNLKAVKRIGKAVAAQLLVTPEQDDEGHMKQESTQDGDVDHLGFTQNDNQIILDHMNQHMSEFKEDLPWDVSTDDQSGSAKQKEVDSKEDVAKDVEESKDEVKDVEEATKEVDEKAVSANEDACGECKNFKDGQCSQDETPDSCDNSNDGEDEEPPKDEEKHEKAPNGRQCGGCDNFADEKCKEDKSPTDCDEARGSKTTKGAIPYTKTPLASEDAAWDGPGQIAAAEPDDLKIMCTWVDPDGDPDAKSSYKLPHHMASGSHSCVLNGVQGCGGAIQGARSPLKVPAGDLAAIKSHLEKHYHDFGDSAPWESDDEKEATKLFKKMMDITTTKAGRRISKDTGTALNEALGKFSEGFGHHEAAMKAHEAVTKAHAKAAAAHDEAIKCYQKGFDAVKSVLDKEEGGNDEQNTEPEDQEPVNPPTTPGQPTAKKLEDVEEVYTVDVNELGEMLKDTVTELKKQLNL